MTYVGRPTGKIFVGLRIAVASWLALAAVTTSAAAEGPSFAERSEREQQLQGIGTEIDRLQRELDQLRGRERGVLGRIERLSGELQLREAQFREVSLQLESVGEEVQARGARLTELERQQGQRHRYLTFRLRQLYRAGPAVAVRQFVGGDGADRYWDGLRYASLLSDRDARLIEEYRQSGLRIGAEQQRLGERERELLDLQGRLEQSRSELEAARAQQGRALASIREDQRLRQGALEELQTAAQALGELVDDLAVGPPPTLDINRFRGLLDWPAEGRLSAGYGTMTHPRFRTRVPHPGWDIDGRAGAEIRSVFDGRVVFASWMRGYGLTGIIDHGNGVVSVYAHASVLLVEPGQSVLRNEVVGRIGETGSLRGPFLYFEMRVDGRPVDPRDWLRPAS